MADLVPVVTQLSDPATWDAAGVINALNAHTWSGAWSISDHNASQSIALACDTIGETQSVIFRKESSGSAANIAVSVSPAQPIEDAGNDTPTAPTTTAAGAMGADWSGEATWDVTSGTPAAGSGLWVAEYPDALLIFMTNSANTFMLAGCYAGRVYQPLDANSSSLGQDGLGFFIGQMGLPVTAATADRMFSQSVGSTAGLLHYETNNWKPRTFVNTTSAVQAGDGTDGETNIFSPPRIIHCDIGGQTVFIGLLKYMRLVGTTATPKTIKAVASSNQGYLHYNNSTAVGHLTFIWDKTKTL